MLKVVFPMQLSHVTVKNHGKYILLDMHQPKHIYIGQLCMATSKNPSVVNAICISSFHYTHVITYRKLRLNKRGN